MTLLSRPAESEALRASEERLQLALRAGGSGVWDWDMSRDVAEVTPSYRELFGLPPGTPVDRYEPERGSRDYFAMLTATVTEPGRGERIGTPCSCGCCFGVMSSNGILSGCMGKRVRGLFITGTVADLDPPAWLAAINDLRIQVSVRKT